MTDIVCGGSVITAWGRTAARLALTDRGRVIQPGSRQRSPRSRLIKLSCNHSDQRVHVGRERPCGVGGRRVESMESTQSRWGVGAELRLRNDSIQGALSRHLSALRQLWRGRGEIDASGAIGRDLAWMRFLGHDWQ